MMRIVSLLTLFSILIYFIFTYLPITGQPALILYIRYGYLQIAWYLIPILFIASIFLRNFNKPGTRYRILKKGLFTLIVTPIPLVLLTFCMEIFTQAALLSDVEKRIGGLITAPYININGQTIEPITVSLLKENGPLIKAGAKEDDIVVDDLTIGQLCSKFILPPGHIVKITVVSGGDGPPLNKRKQRVLNILLP